MDFRSNEGEKGKLGSNQNKRVYQNFTKPKVSMEKATEMVCDVVANGITHDQVVQGKDWISMQYKDGYIKDNAINSLTSFADALKQYKLKIEGKKDGNEILENLENAQEILTKDAMDNEAIRWVLLELVKPIPAWFQESPAASLQQSPEKDKNTATEQSEKLPKDIVNKRLKKLPSNIIKMLGETISDLASNRNRSLEKEQKAKELKFMGQNILLECVNYSTGNKDRIRNNRFREGITFDTSLTGSDTLENFREISKQFFPESKRLQQIIKQIDDFLVLPD